MTGFDDYGGRIKFALDEYELVEQDARDRHGNQFARSWSSTLKARPTARTARADVQDSEIAGRKTIVWNFPARGVSGELENRLGALHMAEACNNLVPGALRAGHETFATGLQYFADEPNEPIAPVVFNGDIFTFHGRTVRRYTNGAAPTSDKDFGANFKILCAYVHNSELVVGLNSTNKLWVRNTSGTWTEAADATYADQLTRTTNQFWRNTATNQVSNIAATANPRTLANWSAGITIGDPTTGATQLLGVGDQLFVCKPEGLFVGDTAASFGNVLEGFIQNQHPDNGKRAIAVGGIIFYPHETGLIKYDTVSETAEEVGIQLQCASAASDKAPGTRVYSLAADGRYLWAACGVGGYPRANPQYVKVTTNNGVSYSNLLANLTDGDMDSSDSSLSSLDTVANGDWLLVGYSTQFAGVLFELVEPNGNTVTMTVDFSEVGATWGTAANLSALDRTATPLLATPGVPGTLTLQTSGYVFWPRTTTLDATSAWVATTIDGVSAFWVRFRFSAALDGTVSIGELRVIRGLNADGPQSHGWIYRGRPATFADNVEQSIVWEPWDAVFDASFPFGLNCVSGAWPHRRGKVLMVSYFCGDTALFTQESPNLYESGPKSYTRGGMATSCRHDGGTPNVNMQFHSITVQGKNIDATRDVRIDYRLGGSTTWTTAASSITASPTTIALSGITGYSIQWRIRFNDFTATNEQATEVNLIEVDFTEIPASRKREFTYMIKLPAEDLDEVGVKLSLLEGYVDNVAMTHIDPLRRPAWTVNVLDVGAAEFYRTPDGQMPALAVPVRCVEI